MARFGVYLPNVGWEGLVSPAALVDYAVAAENLGLDSVWVEDRFLHGRLGILEPLTTLTFVAARTQRLRLGTSILLVNLRNPLVVAKMVSTLDYLSGGRMILGAAIGGSAEEYAAAGVNMKTRVTRFREAIGAIRALLAPESAPRESTLFPLTGTPMEPRIAAHPLPIWLGGKVEAALQRVGTFGDGWLAPSSTTAEDFAAGWAKIQDYARASGRDPTALEPAKFVYIHCSDRLEEALGLLTHTLPRYYSFAYDVARYAIYGPVSRCVEEAQRLLKSGVRTLIFSPVTADHGQLETLARSIIPRLR